jgi:hypothetical protein
MWFLACYEKGGFIISLLNKSTYSLIFKIYLNIILQSMSVFDCLLHLCFCTRALYVFRHFFHTCYIFRPIIFIDWMTRNVLATVITCENHYVISSSLLPFIPLSVNTTGKVRITQHLGQFESKLMPSKSNKSIIYSKRASIALPIKHAKCECRIICGTSGSTMLFHIIS